MEIGGLSVAPASPFGTPLRDVRLEVRAGGRFWASAAWPATGQDELLAVLSGETRVAAGAITLPGQAGWARFGAKPGAACWGCCARPRNVWATRPPPT